MNLAFTLKRKCDFLGPKRVCCDGMIHQICKDTHLVFYMNEKVKIHQKREFWLLLSPINVQ